MNHEELKAADKARSEPNPRYVYIPRRVKVAGGGTVFRTSDGEAYAQAPDGGPMRRLRPKVNGRLAKRQRRLERERRG